MTTTRLRVCTFNIRYGLAPDGFNAWRFRRRAAAAALAAIDADVYGLQEVIPSQRDYLLDRLPGFTAVGVGRRRDQGGEQCPVVFRSARFTSTREETRWYSDEPTRAGSKLPRASHPRIATFAGLDSSDTGTIEVVNTHLDERHLANRKRSVELLSSWIDDDLPRVIMGDFNARPGEVLAPLVDAGYTLAHGDDAGGTFHAFGRRSDGPQIDHILVSPHWSIVNARIDRSTSGRRLPSDHWPVIADLRLDR